MKSNDARELLAQSVQNHLKDHLNLDEPGTDSVAGWFLGPKAQNQAAFLDMIRASLDSHCNARRDYFPDDPVFVTDEIKRSRSYKDTIRAIKKDLATMTTALRGSIPLASYRNQSHMYWDISMPSAVGYFAAMLYNQNNVAVEASPVTTHLEMLVGDDLCEMLGFVVPTDKAVAEGAIRPWGHITCDGSVANLESMWASRNLKYYPISVAEALRTDAALAPAKNMLVPLPSGGSARLIDLDTWALLNLGIDDVLELSSRIINDYEIPESTVSNALSQFSLQSIGYSQFNERFLPNASHRNPAIMAPSTAHYSWPKAAAVLGIGKDTVQDIHVDLDARMSMAHLRSCLDTCLAEQRPVIQVIAVVGSTEESAVDPLADIVALREEYRLAGLEFALHVDGAWGGYFASMLRPPKHAASNGATEDPDLSPAMHMNKYVTRQYEAFPKVDTITVDPHKAGYCPYPSGSLCYRNGSMRNLVAFTAPVVYHGGIDPTVGVYGIEGSKPGAAAAGVWLSHRTIRPDTSGYGKLLGKCFWNSKRLYASVVTEATAKDPFIVVPFQRLPAERAGGSPADIKKQLKFIKNEIVPRSNKELQEYFRKNAKAAELFRELGSDQIIITYSFNFKDRDGRVNTDLQKLADLNNAIYQSLSLHEYKDSTFGQVPTQPMFVTSSTFDPAAYGTALVDDFAKRLGAVPTPGLAIPFMISTTMDPWVSDTADGNFIPEIVKALRSTVEQIIVNSGYGEQPFEPITFDRPTKPKAASTSQTAKGKETKSGSESTITV